MSDGGMPNCPCFRDPKQSSAKLLAMRWLGATIYDVFAVNCDLYGICGEARPLAAAVVLAGLASQAYHYGHLKPEELADYARLTSAEKAARVVTILPDLVRMTTSYLLEQGSIMDAPDGDLAGRATEGSA